MRMRMRKGAFSGWEWIQTLCRSIMSFAMHTGGPCSRTGFPLVLTSATRSMTGRKKRVKESSKVVVGVQIKRENVLRATRLTSCKA